MIALLWTLGCGTPDEPRAPVDPAPAAPAPREGKGKRRDADEDPPKYTLVSLQPGDTACYIELKDASGASKTWDGSFELCPGGSADASALKGKQVRARIGKQKVAAASCQGNPDCPDTELVDFVESLEAGE